MNIVRFPYCNCGRLTDENGCPPCKQVPSRCTCLPVEEDEAASLGVEAQKCQHCCEEIYQSSVGPPINDTSWVHTHNQLVWCKDPRDESVTGLINRAAPTSAQEPQKAPCAHVPSRFPDPLGYCYRCGETIPTASAHAGPDAEIGRASCRERV